MVVVPHGVPGRRPSRANGSTSGGAVEPRRVDADGLRCGCPTCRDTARTDLGRGGGCNGGGGLDSLARPAVEAVAANAGLGRSRSRTVGGWRTLAQGTGLPPWQLRRLTVLLCGAPGWRGLIEVMLETDHDVVTHSAVRNAIRGTLNRRLPAPQGYTIGATVSEPDREPLPKAS
jgi:hypothetical protein